MVEKTIRGIWSKLILKTPELLQWRCSGAFFVFFDLIHFCSVSIVDLEQMNVGWVVSACRSNSIHIGKMCLKF